MSNASNVSKWVGKVAPAFNLLNQEGERVNLRDFRDEKIVVLYFYPKAMTPGCTVQACGMRDFKRKALGRKTVILGVSPDSVERLVKFRKKEKLNFDLLSDPDHKTADAYKAWGPKKFMGREYEGILRQSFIIGMDGAIKHHMAKVNTKTHHEDVFNWISENLQ